MENTFKLALDRALEKTGKSLSSVASAAGVSYDQLRNLRQGKAKTTNVDDARKVANAFGVTLDDFFEGRLDSKAIPLAIAGQVGAGASVDLVDAYEKGDGLYQIERPNILPGNGYVGVEVVGESMQPIYEPGGVLIYRREAMGVPTEAENRICVCEDVGGKVWVKQVKVGSEEQTFSLISINPASSNMHSVQLKWAAPVKMYLPKEVIKIIE